MGKLSGLYIYIKEREREMVVEGGLKGDDGNYIAWNVGRKDVL